MTTQPPLLRNVRPSVFNHEHSRQTAVSTNTGSLSVTPLKTQYSLGSSVHKGTSSRISSDNLLKARIEPMTLISSNRMTVSSRPLPFVFYAYNSQSSMHIVTMIILFISKYIVWQEQSTDSYPQHFLRLVCKLKLLPNLLT